MKEVVLHIGVPKSGTTSLQRALSAEAPLLLPQGVQYLSVEGRATPMGEVADLGRLDPDYWQRQTPGRRLFLADQWRRTLPGLRWRALLSRVNHDSERIILSAENMVHLGVKGRRSLAAAFPNRRIRIVISARSPSRLIQSQYWQTAKIDVVPAFSQWAHQTLEGMLAADITQPNYWCDVAAVSREWQNLGEVTVVQMNQEHAANLSRLFGAVTGLSPASAFSRAGASPHASANTTPKVELLMACQDVLRVNARVQRAELNRAINNVRARFRQELSLRGHTGPSFPDHVGHIVDCAFELEPGKGARGDLAALLKSVESSALSVPADDADVALVAELRHAIRQEVVRQSPRRWAKELTYAVRSGVESVR